ncbi:hypothetical protein yc1106_02802 [Curvularia clavata]|uniref:Rhodopsin domain-containing protein n=1 Tax=Curvularia clavata TaxID=95742 RepID=A0A9Q8Z7Z6_CURCL|nr:hypothetical protein yc1106_02802 [Curvularia clavata]
MQDSLDTARVQAAICHLPNDSKSHQVFVLTIIVYVICFVFVAARTAGKVVSKRITIDDYILVGTFLLAALPVGCALKMAKIGFGNHLWNLKDGALMPILRLFYMAGAVYGVVLGLIKVVLLLSYLNIFFDRRFRLLAYITMAAIVISTTTIFFLSVFLCSPIESFWNRDIKGKCISPRNVSYANSASAIVQDIILLVLPLVYIRNLQVNRWRKIAVGFMFAAGTFGCIATIVRMHTLTLYNISFDPTWDYAPVATWTGLELAAGCVCASLPAIRILASRCLPTSFKAFISRVTNSSNRSGRSNGTGRHAKLPVFTPPTQSQHEWYKPRGRSWMSINDQKDNDLEHNTMELLPVPKPTAQRNSSHSSQFDEGDRSVVTVMSLSSIGCLSDRSYSEEFIRTSDPTAPISTRDEPS